MVVKTYTGEKVVKFRSSTTSVARGLLLVYAGLRLRWLLKGLIKHQGLLGLVNAAKDQKEERIDPKVSAVLEKYHGLFNAPELMPATKAITHYNRLFDEAALPPKYC